MQSPTPKQTLKSNHFNFNKQKLLIPALAPIPYDISLVSNPYLKDNEKYHYLVHKMKQYNERINKGEVGDRYEEMVHERLRLLLGNLGLGVTRDLQVQRVQEVYRWFVKEEKLLVQRVDQGSIRYKMTKEYLDETADMDTSPKFLKSHDHTNLQPQNLLPSQAIKHKNLPYIKHWRTAHKQLQSPEIRLQEYNRKNLNFSHLYSSEKTGSKAPRIVYPKIPKLKYTKEYQVEEAGLEEGKNQNVDNPETQGQTAEVKDGEKPAENVENAEVKPEQPAAQDLGLGQQPQDQPQQQQQPQDNDKLAPRLKSYIHEPKPIPKDESVSHQRMNNRYLKIQHDFIRKQNEDAHLIQMMHSWAARKAQLDKEVIKRIQHMGVNYDKYQHSFEEPEKEEVISIEDAKRFGLSKTFQVKKSRFQVDLASGLQLPSIGNKSDMYEKSIRKDKLNTLKKKFGKLINIKDYDEREIAQSMCQVEHKKKGFSEILRKHSKSKQRIKQLDQVIALKQKLASQKVSIDITALSMSLCAPEDEENLPQGTFPMKSLLSNPFWVQPAKKKKKK